MGTITDVGNAHNSPRMVLRGLGRWPSVTDGHDHRVENNVELDLMVTSLSQCRSDVIVIMLIVHARCS